jgi:hypothetical protein
MHCIHLHCNHCIIQHFPYDATFEVYKATKCWTTGWIIGGSGPGRGWEFSSSPPRPDRLWDQPSLLSSGYLGLFLWGKAAGTWSWPLTSTYYRGQECVELYLHSHYAFMAWCSVKIQEQLCIYLLPLTIWILRTKDISNKQYQV